MPGWVATVLHGEADMLGHLLSFAGAGALTAALLMVLAETGLAWRTGVGGLVMAAGLVGLSLAARPATAAFSLFFIGLGQVTQSSGILSELQQRSPPPLRGRLLGLFTMVFVGMVPLGGLGASLLADAFGAPVAIRGLGLLVALSAALYLGLWTRASMRAGQAA